MYFLHNDTTQSHLILDIYPSRTGTWYIHTILVFFKIVPIRVIMWIVDQNYLQNADNTDSVHTPGYEPLSPEGRR